MAIWMSADAGLNRFIDLDLFPLTELPTGHRR